VQVVQVGIITLIFFQKHLTANNADYDLALAA